MWTKLHQELSVLNEQQRLIVHLRFWENMSILEISKFLKCSWDTADQMLAQALKVLRTHLSKDPDYYLYNKLPKGENA